MKPLSVLAALLLLLTLTPASIRGIQLSRPFSPSIGQQKAAVEQQPSTYRRSPTRNLAFWSRAIRIYGAYKCHQAKSGVRRGLRKVARSGQKNATAVEEREKEAWDKLHETNSNRMLNLCLGLRGFYLKSGQFLATRHDFMPPQYTKKLTKLHDDIPPIGAKDIRKILEDEVDGTIEDYFTELDLNDPVGSASIAQVHFGIWKSTGQKVAVKIQNPKAERLMIGDLNNIVKLAAFLQKTELKFDLLSAVEELQKQISNEFDFVREADNMDAVRKALRKPVPEVTIPSAIYRTKKVLVMTFVEGDNLSKLAEVGEHPCPFMMLSSCFHDAFIMLREP